MGGTLARRRVPRSGWLSSAVGLAVDRDRAEPDPQAAQAGAALGSAPPRAPRPPPSRAREPAAPAACAYRAHAIRWWVEAAAEQEALGLLPFFVAEARDRDVDQAVEIP